MHDEIIKLKWPSDCILDESTVPLDDATVTEWLKQNVYHDLEPCYQLPVLIQNNSTAYKNSRIAKQIGALIAPFAEDLIIVQVEQSKYFQLGISYNLQASRLRSGLSNLREQLIDLPELFFRNSQTESGQAAAQIDLISIKKFLEQILYLASNRSHHQRNETIAILKTLFNQMGVCLPGFLSTLTVIKSDLIKKNLAATLAEFRHELIIKAYGELIVELVANNIPVIEGNSIHYANLLIQHMHVAGFTLNAEIYDEANRDGFAFDRLVPVEYLDKYKTNIRQNYTVKNLLNWILRKFVVSYKNIIRDLEDNPEISANGDNTYISLPDFEKIEDRVVDKLKELGIIGHQSLAKLPVYMEASIYSFFEELQAYEIIYKTQQVQFASEIRNDLSQGTILVAPVHTMHARTVNADGETMIIRPSDLSLLDDIRYHVRFIDPYGKQYDFWLDDEFMRKETKEDRDIELVTILAKKITKKSIVNVAYGFLMNLFDNNVIERPFVIVKLDETLELLFCTLVEETGSEYIYINYSGQIIDLNDCELISKELMERIFERLTKVPNNQRIVNEIIKYALKYDLTQVFDAIIEVMPEISTTVIDNSRTLMVDDLKGDKTLIDLLAMADHWSQFATLLHKNYEVKHYQRAVSAAINADRWFIVAELLTMGLDPNMTVNPNLFLIPEERSTNLKIQFRDGELPILLIAAYENEWAIVRTLIAKGADLAAAIKASEDNGEYILWLLSEDNEQDLLSLFIANGADNSTLNNKKAYVWLDVFAGRTQQAQQRLNTIAGNPDIAPRSGPYKGETALWQSLGDSGYINAELAKDLIIRGASVICKPSYSKVEGYLLAELHYYDAKIATNLICSGGYLEQICDEELLQIINQAWIYMNPADCRLIQYLADRSFLQTLKAKGKFEINSRIKNAKVNDAEDNLPYLFALIICNNHAVSRDANWSLFNKLYFDVGANITWAVEQSPEYSAEVLWLAILDGQMQIAEVLLERNAKLYFYNEYGAEDNNKYRSTLWLAIRCGRWEFALKMISRVSSIFALCDAAEGYDSDDESDKRASFAELAEILGIPAAAGKWWLVHKLVEKGAAIEWIKMYSATHGAAELCHALLVRQFDLAEQLLKIIANEDLLAYLEQNEELCTAIQIICALSAKDEIEKFFADLQLLIEMSKAAPQEPQEQAEPDPQAESEVQEDSDDQAEPEQQEGEQTVKRRRLTQ